MLDLCAITLRENRAVAKRPALESRTPNTLWTEAGSGRLNPRVLRWGGMASGDNYRARANECVVAAGVVADPKSKLVLLELAQRWLGLAGQIDAIADRNDLRGDALLDHPDPLSGKRQYHAPLRSEV